LGKVNPEFQGYLLAQEEGRDHPKVRHSIWGAALAYYALWKRLGLTEEWKEIALPIAGHHSGLHNGGKFSQDLEEFLAEIPSAPKILAEYASALPLVSKLNSPPAVATSRELRIRMIFSALVDADRLNTEKHFSSRKTEVRAGWRSLSDLSEAIEQTLPLWVAGKPASIVNEVRREVLEACRSAALGPRGVYRLTVPTGGGKTLSSLAFALRHSQERDLRRVIVAVPYTSIIDQTVEVYRTFLGEQALLEHHSQVLVRDDEGQDVQEIRHRLATENWAAPLIVTTTVQLFESLLGNRAAKVRKLHNLANSIVLIDEVQTLPVELLEPTLDVLRCLVEEYGVTLVLSTATQPALENSHYLKPFQGLNITEIVPEVDYRRHFERLRRVTYEIWPRTLSHEELAKEVQALSQVMVVLNTRRDALAVIRPMETRTDVFHLSTLLCAAHRRRVLGEVRARLDDGRPIRLISTQVVEAGVDLDFPTVWRALGPLDRIVQAAGRCNREGNRPTGRVVIFELTDGGAPRGPYRVGIEEARVLLKRHSPEELLGPELYREFFERLFAIVPVDKKGIQAKRRRLNYPGVAEAYRLIEEETVPVVVPYEDGPRWLNHWRRSPSRANWQRLQPYLVNIYSREAARLQEEGWPLEPVTEGLYRWLGVYDDQQHTGLAQVILDPSDLIWIA